MDILNILTIPIGVGEFPSVWEKKAEGYMPLEPNGIW